MVENVKTVELENWKRNKVYNEVPFCGQKCLSVRWTFTEKFVDGKKVFKARLVARGFKETEPIQADPPTCSKEAIRLTSTLLVSRRWVCNSIDVKAAFLQGKEIDWDIFIEPPPECEKQNVIWKLNVCVYGLNDT